MNRSPKRNLLGALLVAGLLFSLLFSATGCSTSTSYWARFVVWRGADWNDFERFPARTVPRGDAVFHYTPHQGLKPLGSLDGLQIADTPGTDLETLLTESGTIAFLVARGEKMESEWYAPGFDRTSTVTSFSIAKSVLSLLLGSAVEDGAISSSKDVITDYVPELLESDERFGQIELRHLLTMTSGLRYREGNPLVSDDPRTYYDPNLRQRAFRAQVDEPPGGSFVYNNYNPLLLGLALERSTGQSVSDYLSQKVWTRIGAEADAFWSLDSEANGFEKMESGLNGRAIDFLKLGSMVAHGGHWNGNQIINSDWLTTTTLPAPDVELPSDFGAVAYGSMWWVSEPPSGDPHPYAEGNFGQFLFIAPQHDVAIARFGRTYGDLRSSDWRLLFERVLEELVRPSS